MSSCSRSFPVKFLFSDHRLTSCQWSVRTFSPDSRRCFVPSSSARCHWHSASSEQQGSHLNFWHGKKRPVFHCYAMTSNLRWGQTSSSWGTFGKHLLSAVTAAETRRRRLLHAPVPGAEQLLDALRDFGGVPVLVAHRTWCFSEDGGSVKRGRWNVVLWYQSDDISTCLTELDVRPCSESRSLERPAEHLISLACWRLWEHRHWDTDGEGQSHLDQHYSLHLWLGTVCRTVWDIVYLMKVTWSSYIQGCSSKLGYFPNGGTMRLKTRAMHTKTAGRTIWKNNMLKTCGTCSVIERRGHVSVPERRSPSWSGERSGTVSTTEPQTAASSGSTPSPDTSLYLQNRSTSPSPCSLIGQHTDVIRFPVKLEFKDMTETHHLGFVSTNQNKCSPNDSFTRICLTFYPWDLTCVCVYVRLCCVPGSTSESLLSSSVNGLRQLWWSPPPKACVLLLLWTGSVPSAHTHTHTHVRTKWWVTDE